MLMTDKRSPHVSDVERKEHLDHPNMHKTDEQAPHVSNAKRKGTFGPF